MSLIQIMAFFTKTFFPHPIVHNFRFALKEIFFYNEKSNNAHA